MSERPDPFDWSGGHPALDLVNTLDERPFPSPIETLATYRDLVRFAELAGLIEANAAARLAKVADPHSSRIVGRVRALREHLHAVLAATSGGRPASQPDLDAIGAAVRAAHAARTFRISHSVGLASHQWSHGTAPDVPLHACALAVEDLLINVARERIRKCGASDCGVYFLDTSKARRRQWCSMQNCGNRQKQKRWRLQHQS